MKSGIYKIINTKNNRIYIGSTVNFNERQNTHFRLLKKGNHENKYLQNDFNKHGEENFVFEIILETNFNDLLFDFEQSYLDEFWDSQNNCYNINPIAAKPPSRYGRKCSEELKIKLSKANKGKLCLKKLIFV